MTEALIELARITSPILWTCGGGTVLIVLIAAWTTS